ncbi:MAG: pyridoxal-phosphate dependent enzyme [Candidatus Lokiarchaeota archaeon]|nr:pyridoxal-phosphate dependent enzyme [Candidatus Lokiarchaeota archaeon]MBD3201532.1 pyridoxal-phosphate dependent enzyme [Candidatus Lokiarchaeota archaeon]
MIMNKNGSLPLFDKYPNLGKHIPWIKLAPLNTPVRRLANIAKKYDVNSLWIKRDDLTSPIYGGNKVRKLEFLLGDAIKKKKNKILTIGGIGSNHCVANAAFCSKLGLNAISALADQPITKYVRKNLLLELFFNAKIIYAHKFSKLMEKMILYRMNNKKVYYIDRGGSTPLGTLGFVNAVFELKKEINEGKVPEPDHLFVANGSTGTAAGLSLGIRLANLKTIVHAIRVTPSFISNKKVTNDLAMRTLTIIKKFHDVKNKINFNHLIVDDKYYGEQYGKPTEEGMKAIKILNRKENIQLEPTYTAKVFAGLIDFLQKNNEKVKDETILFWNTYNNRDFSNIINNQDYRKLPHNLHWVFEKPLD